MTLQLLQIALPAAWWLPVHSPRPEFARMVREALDIERRLPKGVDTARDGRRYAAACRSLEAAVLPLAVPVADRVEFDACLAQNGLPAQLVDGGYLEWLAGVLQQVQQPSGGARPAASFFPPEMLAAHLGGIASAARGRSVPAAVDRRLAFARWAAEAGCGLVEVASLASGAAAAEAGPSARAQRIPVPRLVLPISAPAQIQPAPGLTEWAALRREMEQSVEDGQAVNFGRYRHHIITVILHEYIYRASGHAAADVPVLYADGSQAAPFPLRTRHSAPDVVQQAEAATALRVALLSTRHPEMDAEVDLAWLPNRGASRLRDTQADTDAWCYRRSLEQFRSFPPDRLTVIDLYHTGLETAVIAFYRALVTGLHEGWLNVAVRPRLFRGTGLYTAGKWWV